jgi:hypothetical protein
VEDPKRRKDKRERAQRGGNIKILKLLKIIYFSVSSVVKF